MTTQRTTATRGRSPWVQPPSQASTQDLNRFIKQPWEGAYACFNMLIYGEPGEGKTPLIGTIVEEPRLMPALLVNCDSGTLSIRERDTLSTIHLSAMASELSIEKGAPINEWDALESIYAWLRGAEHEFKTVILDGGTDLEQFCEIACLVKSIDQRTIDGKTHDEELSELADYRRIQQRMKRMYVRFRDIRTIDGRRMNFLATAHEGKMKDNTGSIMVQPLYIGKGTVLVQSVFDIIARLSTEQDSKTNKEVKRLTFKVAGKNRARSRVKELGSHIDDPTLSKITDKIFGASK